MGRYGPVTTHRRVLAACILIVTLMRSKSDFHQTRTILAIIYYLKHTLIISISRQNTHLATWQSTRHAGAPFSIFGAMCWTRDADEKPPRSPSCLLHPHHIPARTGQGAARRPIPATRTVDFHSMLPWVRGWVPIVYSASYLITRMLLRSGHDRPGTRPSINPTTFTIARRPIAGERPSRDNSGPSFCRVSVGAQTRPAEPCLRHG